MKDVLLAILAETRERFRIPGQDRAISLDPAKPKVQTIIGPRRAGKSSLLKLAIHKLLNDGVEWRQICYLPLEDERLRGEAFKPDLILQAFGEMHPENPGLDNVFFFFDEIQYLPEWEAFINRVHEQVSRRVIITGSNSKTLHTEVASVLRGRGLPLELLAAFLFPNIFNSEILLSKLTVLKRQLFWRLSMITFYGAAFPKLLFPARKIEDPCYRNTSIQCYTGIS